MSADCPEALDRLYEYLDGELTRDKIAEVSRHLAACYPCKERADFERHLQELVRTCARTTAPEGLLEKVQDRVRAEDERLDGGVDV